MNNVEIEKLRTVATDRGDQWPPDDPYFPIAEPHLAEAFDLV